MSIKPIETSYAGCRFRSRLEARWAVFFDQLEIPWEYEPQGFAFDGRAYLPDFLLTDCGTWVEVKGAESELDHDLMEAAAHALPGMPGPGEPGPRLLILGPIPKPPDQGDLAWLGLDPTDPDEDDGPDVLDGWWGFGNYGKNRRPWRLVNTSTATGFQGYGAWLEPALDPTEDDPRARAAYTAARSARFERGQSGAIRTTRKH